MLANLEEEIAGALRWAQHYKLVPAWDESSLLLTVRLEGQADQFGVREPYLLTGRFDDYRVIPPAWKFADPRTGNDIGLSAFPAAGTFPGGSVLHPNGIICAPWNRLAFKTSENPNGVHDNWGDLSGWEGLEPTYTQARTIPEMLARLRLEVGLSPLRLAPLPPLESSANKETA